MKSRWRFSWILATLAAATFNASAETDGADLESRDINHARDRRAVCNDFSPAVYFMRRGTSPGWVIYFEGGGGCSNFSDCNQRYLNNPEQMKAPVSTSSIVGEDILSSDPTKNPVFHSYTHVLVPYCSSDAWLGNRTTQRFDDDLGFSFDSSDLENSDNFVYAGQDILRAVIEDLCELELELGNATDIMLVGSSAGGIGLLSSLDWINTMVPANTTRLVLDSSWFVSYAGHHVLQFNEEAAKILNFAPPACHDLSLGYPCCVSPACLFTKGYLHSVNTPILAISSVYDIYTLQQPLRELGQKEGQDDQALLALFNSYGSIVSESLLQSYKTHPLLSVYAPSCSQHVYLAPSGTLRETTQNIYQESLFRLTNPVEAGNWERVAVRTDSGTSLTLLRAVEQWANNSGEQFFVTDTCSGPACGTCPSDISFSPETQLWSTTWNYLVLALAGLMTLVAVFIKTSAYLYMKYLLLQQRLYSIEASRNPRNRSFPKPTHPVNISCTELSHHIESVRGSAAKTPESHEATDGLEVSSPEHHYTNAKLEQLVPGYRLLCSRWYQKWALWQQNRAKPDATICSQSQLIHSTIIRPDSGISSTEDSVIKTGKTQTEEVPTDGSASNSSDEFDTRSFDVESSDGRELPARKHRKTILDQVNLYINPGELVAIMGPSGSGKTTLLDVLLNKRTTGVTDGEILINGVPMSKMRRWFVGNTGYVRQLATYYYNELTVRENLLFSMNMQAMRGTTLRQKLERVEQVIREMGLQEQADVKVGDSINGGLSGGQRRRLAVAVQLLSVPNILFLDEPTSGLDSASSLEILKSLSMLAETGRAVVVTIHQPRSEIFHSFDKILLLCRGRVAFFGSPIKVWDFFTQALNYEDESLSDSGSSTNTADRILDLLKEQRSQQQVLRKYRSCGEPTKVKCAVWRGKGNAEHTPLSPDSRNPGFWHRLVSLEARASLRQTTFTIIYLPIVYLVFGTILGTTYLYTNTPVQVMSVTCLLSCSSSLFMSSIIMSLLVEPLKLFRLEHSDGISSAHELILQVFIRMSSICTLPLAVCATFVFMLVYQNYSLMVYVTVLLTFLLVNQCWLALFILFTVLYPQQAHRLCPVFSAIGGFCCGFIIPKPLMPVYYAWIFYINPSYYAYAATTVTVLHNNDLGGCTRDSPLECFRVSSAAVLDSFGLAEVNPIQYMVILMGMVWVLLLLAIVILQLKVTYPVIKESLEPLFCCLVKGRKRRRQVHSSEALGLVKHNPTCSLHLPSSDLAPQSSNSKLPNYNTVIDLEAAGHGVNETDTSKCVCNTKDGDKDRAVCTHFLLDGKHKVEFDFPWERPRPPVDEDSVFDDVSQPTVVAKQVLQPTEPSQPILDAPRIQCDGQSQEPISPVRKHAVLRRGMSLGLGYNRHSTAANRGSTVLQNTLLQHRHSAVVQLTMDEDEEGGGIDEGTRRELATEKWKLRRLQMDIELKRLKHNEERERVRRHSGAFFHQALDPREQEQQQSNRRIQSSRAGASASNISHWKPSSDRRVNRSRSMQVSGGLPVSRAWSRLNDPLVPPRLEITQEEDEEEEEEEEAGLGLPPKDIPFFEDKTTAGSIALDMSQIPVAEIAESIPSQSSDHSWNTEGGQDSAF